MDETRPPQPDPMAQPDTVLPQELEESIDRMVRQQMYTDAETDKVIWFAQARKCMLYWSGRQWLVPVLGPENNVVDWAPLPAMNTMEPKANEPAIRGRYDTIENYVRGDGNKFAAVLGEKSPNPKALALDGQSPEADARAKLADRILNCIRRLWNVEEVHRMLVMSAWHTGTFFLYTPWEVDAEKYGEVTREVQEYVAKTVADFVCATCGTVQQGVMEDPPQTCSSCATPGPVPTNPQTMNVAQTKVIREPASAPGLYDATFYEVTVPFFVTVLQFGRTPWLIYEQEAHRGELLEQYPILWKKINGNINEQSWPDNSISQSGYYTRNTRATVNVDMRQTSRYRWTKSLIWMRPSQYNMFGDELMTLPDGSNGKIRDWLRVTYPHGCRITRVGKWLVDIQSEQQAWHWSVGTPMITKTVNCDPVALDFLQIQDAINSVDNLFQENMERNLPITLANQDLINIEALRERPGSPGELLPVSMDAGTSLKEALYNLPTSQLDGQNFGYREKMLETGREITGVTKAIFGASNASTAHEAELQKTQAMLQLGLVWKGLQNCWKGAYENALRMLSMYGADVLQRWGLSREDVDNAAMLVDAQGNLNGIRVAVEEGIPATWGQIRDAVMFLIQQGPPSWQLSGLNHPSNAAKVQDSLGIPDWTTPGGHARKYVLKLVKRMLQGQVQQPQMDPMTGQPMIDPMTGMPSQPQPTEMIDQLVLPPPLGIPLLQEWFMSDEGMEAALNNAPGYENLHLAFQMYSAPPPMPPGQEGEGGADANQEPGPPPPPGQGPEPVGPEGPGQQAISQPARLQLLGKAGS